MAMPNASVTYNSIIRPAMLQPGMEGLADAKQLMLAIAYQESGCMHRVQLHGPARGLWQFEKPGIAGVLAHSASRPRLLTFCHAVEIKPTVVDLHKIIRYNDIVAAVLARLLLWTDPHPLPETENAGWRYYLRNWRPGKPRPEHWAKSWNFGNV